MQYAAAILYGWAASVLAAIVLGFAHGGLDHHSAVFALCIGALVSFGGCLHARRIRAEKGPPRGWEWFPIVLFALFTARAFLWLIFTERDELRVLSPNNLGDMSLHLTYIEYFAKGAPFWPDNPIFASGKLAYSVGVDLFNSLLLLAGLDILRGLLWVGLIGATLTAISLWHWGRGFTLMSFLCASGLIGFACFSQPADQPFFQDYPGQLNLDWAWKSLPLSLLVTQRGFLFAFPAGLLLLASWRTRFLLDGKGARLPFMGELLLYASMPVFHLHTFLALSFVLACWFIARPTARKKIGIVVGAAFIPATVLVFVTIGMFQANALPDWGNMSEVENPPRRPPTQVLGWQPGWMVNEPLNKFDPWPLLTGDDPSAAPWEAHGRFLLFWLGNFGVLPFLAAVAAWKLMGRIRGKPLPVWWAVTTGLAFVFITPFLGQFPSYQKESVHGWLLGSGVSDTFANVAMIVAGLGLIFVWLFAEKRQRLTPLVRVCLLIAASVLIADGLAATAKAYAPTIRSLRANAIPLIAATVAFLLFLRSMARTKQPDTWPAALLFPGLYLFFVCCNVKFAPSLWDNTKLMVWAHLLLFPAIWVTLISRWSLWMRGVAMVGLFFSGFVTLIGGLNSQYEGFSIASVSELQELRDATSNIPITETFAAEPSYNHPLLLIGRKVVLGYPSHVWSHGIDYATQDRRLDGLMNGGKDWRLHASRLGTRYLFFGPREANQWPDSLEGWRGAAAIVAEGKDWVLFDLETPPVPVTQ